MKEALKKHLESLGYSAEQITAILNGVQEPEQQTLKPEEQEKLEKYDQLSKDYKKLQGDYRTLEQTNQASVNKANQLLIESQVRAKLSDAKVKDMDYAMFKLKQEGEFTLGEDQKVVGLDARVEALKSAIPDNFIPAAKTVVVNKPEQHTVDDSVTEPQTLREAVQQVYSEQE